MATKRDPRSKLDMAKTALTTAGSIATSAMVVHKVLRTYLPQEVQEYIYLGKRNLINRLLDRTTMDFDEFEGLDNNEIYNAVEIYLTTRVSDDDTLRLKVKKLDKEKEIVTAIDKNQELTDKYNGILFKWIWKSTKENTKPEERLPGEDICKRRSEIRSFELSFNKKYRETVQESYLQYIMNESKKVKNEIQTVKIHTLKYKYIQGCHDYENPWTSVNLDHPSTFETVAMESRMKEMVMKDLEKFVKRKDYYKKVGKAWKRGYLLYGPPGTGKSSLIAAMANYLNFDIYDLELADIMRNEQLREVLLHTTNRSILVIEDIDCSLEFKNRNSNLPYVHPRDVNKVTLSGLLNLIDGLWSSCGDERIIIFTTNYKEKLDPALLRLGRMDLHIHLSYCTTSAFKTLAKNYLNIKDHQLFTKIGELLGSTEVSPADVAEQLMKSDDVDSTLLGLIDFLETKFWEKEEAKSFKLE